MSAHDAKVVFVGEKGVGKTCLCIRYVEGVYRSDMPATIGAAFMTKRLQMDGHLFRLQLWDTAGQERFRAMAPMYYRGASIAIIVFDVTDEDSFAEADLWVKELKDKCGTNDLALAIAANKCDVESGRVIPTKKGEDYAKSVGAVYFETSAKENIGIEDMFSTLIRKILVTKKEGLGQCGGKQGEDRTARRD